MAKLQRESRLRERRAEKQARKDARKRGMATQPEPPDMTLNEELTPAPASSQS